MAEQVPESGRAADPAAVRTQGAAALRVQNALAHMAAADLELARAYTTALDGGRPDAAEAIRSLVVSLRGMQTQAQALVGDTYLLTRPELECFRDSQVEIEAALRSLLDDVATGDLIDRQQVGGALHAAQESRRRIEKHLERPT